MRLYSDMQKGSNQIYLRLLGDLTQLLNNLKALRSHDKNLIALKCYYI